MGVGRVGVVVRVGGGGVNWSSIDPYWRQERTGEARDCVTSTRTIRVGNEREDEREGAKSSERMKSSEEVMRVTVRERKRMGEVFLDFLMNSLRHCNDEVTDGQRAGKITINVPVDRHSSLQATIDSHVLIEPATHSGITL